MMPFARVQRKRRTGVQLWSALAVSVCAALWGADLRAENHEGMIKSHGYSFYGDLSYPAALAPLIP